MADRRAPAGRGAPRTERALVREPVVTLPRWSSRCYPWFSMDILEAPHGINVVVETERAVYIGRFDGTNGFQVLMHDCAVHLIERDEDVEAYVRQTAKYGVAVDQRDVVFDATGIKRVRLLRDVSKE